MVRFSLLGTLSVTSLRSSDIIVGVVEGPGLRVELLKFAGTVFRMGRFSGPRREP